MSPHGRTKELKTYRKQEAKYLNSQIHIETENYQLEIGMKGR